MAASTQQRMWLFSLPALVVGSMIGARVFSLPRTFASASGPLGAIIAWCVAGGGMYTLAGVIQALAERQPDLDSGVYASAYGRVWRPSGGLVGVGRRAVTRR